MRTIAKVGLLCAAGVLVPAWARADSVFLVGSGFGANSQILEFDGTTGAYLGIFASAGPLEDPHGLVFGSNGNLFVASAQTNQILEYNGTTQAYLGVFASGNGLNFPSDLAFGPDGTLYVASNDGCECIQSYNGTTGAFIEDSVPIGDNPQALALGPNGLLYVTVAHSTNVLILNPTTGGIVSSFSGVDGAGEGLSFGPNGDLYISGFNCFGAPCDDQSVGMYTPAGAFLGNFVPSEGVIHPYALSFGPDGNLYVGSNLAGISVFNGSGALINTIYNTINGGGLSDSSLDIAFLPGQQVASPEPGSLALLSAALGAVLIRLRKRRARTV